MYKKVDLYFKILKLSNNCGFAVTLVCHVNRIGRDESNWYKGVRKNSKIHTLRQLLLWSWFTLGSPKTKKLKRIWLVNQRKWHSKSHQNTFYKTHLCLWCFFCKEPLEMEKICLLLAHFMFVAPSDIDQQANWRGESLKIKKGECGGMHRKNILITKIIILAHFEF